MEMQGNTVEMQWKYSGNAVEIQWKCREMQWKCSEHQPVACSSYDTLRFLLLTPG